MKYNYLFLNTVFDAVQSPHCLVPLGLVPLGLVPLCLVPLCLVSLCLVPLCLVPLCLVPLCLVPLCLVFLWIWKNLGLWKFFQQKILCKKICILTNCELHILIFSFKYDFVIIKQPSSCSYGKKIVKICKFLNIKNHRCLVSLTNLWKHWLFSGY